MGYVHRLGLLTDVKAEVGIPPPSEYRTNIAIGLAALDFR